MIPTLWTLTGQTAVFFLEMWKDAGLILAGLAALPMLLARTRHIER